VPDDPVKKLQDDSNHFANLKDAGERYYRIYESKMINSDRRDKFDLDVLAQLCRKMVKRADSFKEIGIPLEVLHMLYSDV
jgi:hypothetical protein